MGTYPRACATSTASILRLSIDATAEWGIYFRGGLKASWFRKRATFSKYAATWCLIPSEPKRLTIPGCGRGAATGQLADWLLSPAVSRWMSYLIILLKGAPWRSRNTDITWLKEYPARRSGRT